jgi:type II secretory pathway component PulC
MPKWMTKKNVTIANLVLAAVFLVTLVAVAIPFLKSEPAPSPSFESRLAARREAVARERKETGTPVNTEQILARVADRDLFDAHLIAEKPVEIPPPPPLQWELAGVTSIRGEPIAVIRDRAKRTPSGQTEYMVHEGDEVEGYFGVRIMSISINPPSVTYNRPGVGDETLTMGTTTGAAGQPEKDQWAEVIRAVRAGHTYVVKLPELQQKVGSAEAYMGTFGFEPNMEGTRPDGLKITSLDRSNLLYEAGLRPGDIVKTINGNSIGDQTSLLDNLAEAAKGFNIQVGIQRGRATQTIFYTLLKK